MILAQNNPNDQIFGKVSPPPGAEGLNKVDPATGLANLLVVSIQLVFIVAGIALLIYMIWGAFDWITSGGDKENVAKARSKMTNAFIGIILVVIVLGIFAFITGGGVLGIFNTSNGGLQFNLPHL